MCVYSAELMGRMAPNIKQSVGTVSTFLSVFNGKLSFMVDGNNVNDGGGDDDGNGNSDDDNEEGDDGGDDNLAN